MENEGLNIKEIAIIFGPIILVIVIVSFFFKWKQTSKDDFYNYVVPSEFHGVIVEKYEHFNHAEPRIQYQLNNSILEMSASNWLGLYERTEIGDSIFKLKGDIVLYVKKKENGSTYKFNYRFGKGWSIVRR